MRLIYPQNEAQNEALRDWLADRYPHVVGDHYRCIGIANDDNALVGAVIYFDYRHPSIEIGIVCEDTRWIWQRPLMLEVLAYPFVDLGCLRITARTPSAKLADLLSYLGFEREGTIRCGARDGGDVGLYGLLRKDLKCDTLRRGRNTVGTTLKAATS